MSEQDPSPHAGRPDAQGASQARARRFPSGTWPPTTRRRLEEIDVRPHIRRDPWPAKLLRRAITVPVLVALTALWWGLMPLIGSALVVADLVRRRPLLLARFYLMIGLILLGQVWGLALLFSLWLACGAGLAWRRCNRWTLRAEAYWAQWNADVMAWVYGIRYEVEGSAVLRDGPSLLLMRHVSINDTILPISLITSAHGVRMRIVLKRELLFAPIVDGIGHRIPTAFIRRASGDPTRELAAVRAITGDLHPDETIMIFPEGTRFSEARRAQIIGKLRDKDPAAAARAEELTHVLPMRLGGVQALMEGAPQADLVFCAHTGYERAVRLEDFIGGGLYRTTVKVKFWRVAAREVPADPEARAAFLHAEWRKVNAWVAAHQAARTRN